MELAQTRTPSPQSLDTPTESPFKGLSADSVKLLPAATKALIEAAAAKGLQSDGSRGGQQNGYVNAELVCPTGQEEADVPDINVEGLAVKPLANDLQEVEGLVAPNGTAVQYCPV